VVGRIDLALFVTGPEPPITQEELEFLEKVAKFAERVFVVVAKIDRATDGAEEIVQFTQGMLEQVNSGGMRLFAVDSTQQDGRLNLLRRAILETLKEEGDRVLQRARGRRVRRVGAAIRQSVELRRAAVLLPRQERELARAGFGELIVETQERADDLVHAIDRFPDEEMHYVDALLQRLSDEAARRIAPEAFAAEAPEGAEGEIYRCVGAEEQVWSERVFCEMQSHIESRQNTIVRRTAELERQFLQAGCEVLGLNAPVTRDDLEFGKRQAASRLSGPMPTTGLEIVTSSLLGALPAPARAQALRRRFSHLIPQLLDRSRGRVRSAALEYLTNWRYSYRAQIAQRLAEARRVVEDAFAQASQPGGSEEATQLQVQRIRHDSERLEALLAQLADASASD
jgi:hypothetical protein